MDSFTFAGINSADFGVYVFPTDDMLQAPERAYTEYVVPGRNGVLLIDDGRYGNTTRTYGAVMPEGAGLNLALARDGIASSVGYQRLTDTFDPEHYFLAAYRGTFAPKQDWRDGEKAKVKIAFQRKPERYLISGETPIALDLSGSGMDSIYNPTLHTSKPLIHVTRWDNDDVYVAINGTRITFGRDGDMDVYIDCETETIYKGTPTSVLPTVGIEGYNYPTLEPGDNGISTPSPGNWGIEIIPRWWEL